MKRIIKTFALFTISFLLSISFVLVGNAQVKKKKFNRPRKAPRTIAPVKVISTLDNNSCSTSQNTPKPDLRRTPPRTSEGYLISDCEPMNLTVLYQPKPIYSKAARAVRASGLVTVDVVIDEDGKVIWAKIIEGHPLLHAQALRAACRTRFKPVVDCLKRRLKTNTVLNYNFKIDN